MLGPREEVREAFIAAGPFHRLLKSALEGAMK